MNMKYYKTIVIMFFLMLINSCSSIKKELIPTNNKGGYKIMLLKNNKKEILISGKVIDVVSRKPLSSVQVFIGCTKTITSTEGNYSLKVSISDVKQYVEASTVGYKKVKTNFLNLNSKTNFKIDFFLEEDDSLLIDCN